MKKLKFKRSGLAGKGMYIALCAGILAVGAATAAGYKAAVGSLTQNLIPDQGEIFQPDVDLNAVNNPVDNVEKNTPEFEFPPIPTYEAPTQDITNELQTLFYEQAKMMPVSGEILTEFSWGELVKSSGGVWKTHDGVDISADTGTNVKSMTAGTVKEIYSDPLWGNCVVIDHGETVMGYYFGLSPDISVNIGDSVSAGTVIGTVGNTADIESDLDAHLHFALKHQGAWVDPVSYIEPMK